MAVRLIKEDEEKKYLSQREDLNPFEKALGIRHLMEKYNLTQEQVAKKLGKSRRYKISRIRNRNKKK